MNPKKPRKPAKKKFKAYKAERVFLDPLKLRTVTDETTLAVIVRGRVRYVSGCRGLYGYPTSTVTFVTDDGYEIDVTVRALSRLHNA